MSAKIFYVSGSGNSLAVAKTLAAGPHTELIPVASLINQRRRLTTNRDAAPAFAAFVVSEQMIGSIFTGNP